ncbi:TPA: hypothetical protein ACPY5T_002312 [Yersinia enterocolitica]
MLSKELINGAMLSSLEGFSFSVVDSLEFELNRKLTANEHQEVFAFVGSAVPDSASLREQLAELKAWATNRAITDDARENENYTTLKIDYRQRQLRELLKAAKPAED